MVGLILLAILTLLAVSGMNTASTELVMAGNEQFRQRAFAAAAMGIEAALVKLATVPQTGEPVKVENVTAPSSSDDTDTKYSTSSEYLGDDLNVPGFSAGKFVGFHYQITSDGVSTRGARSEQIQGAFVIQNAGGAGSFSSLAPPSSATGP